MFKSQFNTFYTQINLRIGKPYTKIACTIQCQQHSNIVLQLIQFWDSCKHSGNSGQIYFKITCLHTYVFKYYSILNKYTGM